VFLFVNMNFQFHMCIVVRKTSVHSQNVSGYSGYKLHYYMSEILYIEKWADENNLRLNCAKSKELIFTAISSRATSSQLPVECLNIERVTSLRILGVIISNRLTATEHVNNLLSSCSSLLYAMRVLQSHGTRFSATWCFQCNRRCEGHLLCISCQPLFSYVGANYVINLLGTLMGPCYIS